MKLAITSLLVLCSLFTVAQNNYRILKVEGCIKISESTDCLSKNITLNGNETFHFDSIGSFAVVMEKSGKILSLKAPDTVGFYNGRQLQFTFAESAKSAKIKKEEGTSRGTEGQQITHFNYFFGTSRFTVIGDEARFGVNPLLYPITKDKFLVVNYKINNISISKKLGFRDQVIRLQKNSLMEFQGKTYLKDKIDNVSIYYYEPATKKSELLVTFDLFFINPENLDAEFNDVYNQLPNKTTMNTDDIESSLSEYFENTYGKTEPQSLQFIMDQFISKLTKN